jgi:GNAT superfamily N-acetyltransferase
MQAFATDESGFSVALRLGDGTPVRWRYVKPGDRAAFSAGFEKLSERSRYLRFQQPVDDLPEGLWAWLFDSIDQRSHIALVLYAGDAPIALCRLIRLPNDWHTADVAVTVADDWQGRGAGGLLLEEALRVAGDVRSIDTQVLLSNIAAIRMLQSVGELRLDCVQGHCRARVDVVVGAAA